MNKIHNKEGPDHDVGCHIFRLSRDEITKLAKDRNERRPRDGTMRMPRDGTVRMARDGTQRMPRDGTERMPRDGKGRLARDGIGRLPRDGIRERQINVSNQNEESTWVPLKYPIKPPGKGFFNRENNFRRRNEIGGKPALGCGEAELCPDGIGAKNDKFSKFAALGFENLIMNKAY